MLVGAPQGSSQKVHFMPDPSSDLRDFFNYLWGEEAPIADQPTYVYLPVQTDPYGPNDWQKFMFSWPRQREAVIRHVLKWTATRANVFFSPALYKRANPDKENVLGSHVLWVDFDGNAPQEWPLEGGNDPVFVPPPTLIVQSSLPGHEHCYWMLDCFLSDIELLEDRNRAIAYVKQADTSGWDADQILRPIRTTNFKRNLPVIIKAWER